MTKRTHIRIEPVRGKLTRKYRETRRDRWIAIFFAVGAVFWFLVWL